MHAMPVAPAAGREARMLCLAGTQTTAMVSKVAAEHGLELVTATTCSEAVELAQCSGPWCAVVAALGTRRGVDLLFDRGDDGSSLISTAKGLSQQPLVAVYSHTACGHGNFAQACYKAGADAVVCTASELRELVVLVEARSALLARPHPSTSSTAKVNAAAAATPVKINDDEANPQYQTLLDYPVLNRRLVRDHALELALGIARPMVQRSKKLTASVQAMLEALARPLMLPPQVSGTVPVRLVHVSDTHHHHGRVHLPLGEVLLHTGDFVGNYGHSDLREHLADFLQWLHEVGSAFRLVVLVAGNHDTILETDEIKELFLRALPPNAVYLENSGTEYRGLRIWGSPTNVCREETMGKRYLSNAFERPLAEREQIWAQVPNNLDVLLTHTPPMGILCSEGVGCSSLASRLKELKPPPQVHFFGHDHDHFGVKATSETIFVNGAQEEVLRLDRNAPGCVLAP